MGGSCGTRWTSFDHSILQKAWTEGIETYFPIEKKLLAPRQAVPGTIRARGLPTRRGPFPALRPD